MSEISQETARELVEACEAVRFYFWEPHPDGRPFSPESEVQESLETALAHARADLAHACADLARGEETDSEWLEKDFVQ